MRISRFFSLLGALLSLTLGASVFATWTLSPDGRPIPGWGGGAHPAWSGFILLIVAVAALTAIVTARAALPRLGALIVCLWIALSGVALAVTSHSVAGIRGLVPTTLPRPIEPAAMIATFSSVLLLVCGLATLGIALRGSWLRGKQP